MNDSITWNAPDGDNPARRVSQRSLDCVSRKAKDEWLDLFAEDAVLEDPVGPSFFDPEGKGHAGREGIGAFWDMAIGPLVEFRATIHDSFANGNNVANIGVFSTTLGDGTKADTELVAAYRLNADGKIQSLRAYWEIDRMMQTLRKD